MDDEKIVRSLQRVLPRLKLRVRSLSEHDPQLAEDLVQDAIVKLLSLPLLAIDMLEWEEKRLTGWCNTVIRNQLVDRGRTLGRNRAHSQHVVDAQRFREASLARQQGHPNVDIADRVKHAIAKLPASLSDILKLRYLDEMEIRDVARQVGKSQGHTRRLLKEAERRLVALIDAADQPRSQSKKVQQERNRLPSRTSGHHRGRSAQ